MNLPSPQNDEEASYLAFAMVRELIATLINKQVIGDSEVTAMLGRVIDGLNAQPNHATKRAAAFLARAIEVEK